MTETLDSIDAKILDLIQHDAGLSVAEIADRVGLSSSPCWRRIKRLEDAGVIQKRVTILDREKLGLGFEVFAEIKLALPSKDNLEAFEAAIVTHPAVLSCHATVGATDYLLHIAMPSMAALDAFLRETLWTLPGVERFTTTLAMRTIKDKGALAPNIVAAV